MSKPIRVTRSIKQEIKKRVLMAIDDIDENKITLDGGISLAVLDGKVSLLPFAEGEGRRAIIKVTERAFIKQEALIQGFEKEIAWNGIATKESSGVYKISDILVHPQTVSGSNVTSDQEEYQDWLMSQDDEVFNNIRVQGHSHVRMGVSPSGTDRELYKKITSQLNKDMFYIFMIFNKMGDFFVLIYDLEDNILYETEDVDIEIVDEEYGYREFLDEADELVTISRLASKHRLKEEYEWI